MTTTANHPIEIMSKCAREAIVDQLRACKSPQEILEFEVWFNKETNSGPLYEIICDFLRNRYISRGIAAKWLKTLLEDKENKLHN